MFVVKRWSYTLKRLNLPPHVITNETYEESGLSWGASAKEKANLYVQNIFKSLVVILQKIVIQKTFKSRMWSVTYIAFKRYVHDIKALRTWHLSITYMTFLNYNSKSVRNFYENVYVHYSCQPMKSILKRNIAIINEILHMWR